MLRYRSCSSVRSAIVPDRWTTKDPRGSVGTMHCRKMALEDQGKTKEAYFDVRHACSDKPNSYHKWRGDAKLLTLI